MHEHVYEHPGKAYVQVACIFYPDGRPPVPTTVWWEDGRQFDIDRVSNVCRAASLKAGGIGWRYTCRIKDRETYVWYDDGLMRWFVERRGAPEPLPVNHTK